MSTQRNLDGLSSLPDEILSHILTLIPMKAAVQTSVLSTRWRYLFVSMSSLDFDDMFSTTTNVRSLKIFVYRWLLRFPNQGSLECFRLTYITMAYHDCLCHLIYGAFCRGVKEIDLMLFGLDHMDEIVTPLFTCQSLVTLKLDSKRLIIPVPSTICLPNLKSLHFRHLIVTDDSISRLISSCCVLEDLVLDVSGCDNPSEINIQSLSLKTLVLNYNITVFLGFDSVVVINAPSLVHFWYNGYIAKDYTISNMTSLIKAEIRILCFDDVDREQSVIHFLQGICNVRSLYLSIDDIEETLFQTRIDPVLAFPNLVELKFHICRNHWIKTRLVEFLHCIPNLKTLILNLAFGQRTFMFPPEVPSCLSSHLKEIKISNFQGEEHVFEMISYFLENGMVLEKLRLGIVTHDGDLSFPSLRHFIIFKKLLSLPRSSSTCQVLTF